MDLTAIILAGGRSRRMGRPKAFLRLGNETLLGRAVRTVRELDPLEVFVSGRKDRPLPNVSSDRVLWDLEPELGPLAGIERGLAHCQTPFLLVLAVDLPCMTAGFLRRLLGHCDATCGAVPRLDGRLEPLAAIYPASCHQTAHRMVQQGQLAVQAFATACLFQRTVRILEVLPEEAALFQNWNTPADVAVGQPSTSVA